MHRFVVFFVGVVVLVKTDIDIRRCFETVMFNGPCCQFNLTDEKMALMSECSMTTPSDRHACEYEECYAKKVGFMLSNGTLDPALIEKAIEEDFENYTDIMEVVKEKCLGNNLTDYGPPHSKCYLNRLANCLHMQTMLNCPDWQETDHCNEVKDIMDECEDVYL